MKMHIIRSPEGVWSEPIDYFEDISVQFIFQAQHIPKKKNMLFFSRKPVGVQHQGQRQISRIISVYFISTIRSVALLKPI